MELCFEKIGDQVAITLGGKKVLVSNDELLDFLLRPSATFKGIRFTDNSPNILRK